MTILIGDDLLANIIKDILLYVFIIYIGIRNTVPIIDKRLNQYLPTTNINYTIGI